MAEIIAVIGDSGSGKSTSLEKLNNEETALINIVGKRLPFEGGSQKYVKYNKDSAPKGNMYIGDHVPTIIAFLKYVSEQRKEIKQIIVDDTQYVSGLEFFKRALEKGYDKFSEIGKNMVDIINTARSLRDDLRIIFTFHTDTEYDAAGNKKIMIKTIGKMLREKFTPEGMFNIVLLSEASRDPNDERKINYRFVTNNDGTSVAKSPKGMFEMYIPNDLDFVLKRIKEYYGE